MLSPEAQTAILRSFPYKPMDLVPHDLFKVSPPDIRISTILTDVFTEAEIPLIGLRIATTGLSPASELMDPLAAVAGNGSNIATLFSHLQDVRSRHAANIRLSPSQDISVYPLDEKNEFGATFALTATTDETMINAYQETQLVPAGSVGFVLNVSYRKNSPGNEGMRSLLTVLHRSLRYPGVHARFAIIEPQDRIVHLAASYGDIITPPPASRHAAALIHAARMVNFYNPDSGSITENPRTDPLPVHVWTHGSNQPFFYIPEVVQRAQKASGNPLWINGVMRHIDHIQSQLTSQAMTTMTVSFLA